MEPPSKIVMYKQWFIDSHVGNIKDVYHFEERVGSGGFGVVYLATHKKSGKSPFMPHLKKAKNDNFRGQICH